MRSAAVRGRSTPDDISWKYRLLAIWQSNAALALQSTGACVTFHACRGSNAVHELPGSHAYEQQTVVPANDLA
jgi:hypothetical protein